MIREAAQQLTNGERELVVIVDGMEKYTPELSKVAGVYRRVADLFANYPRLLRLPSCHTIYTVPPYLQHFNKSVAKPYNDLLRTLPCVKVQTPQPDRAPAPIGIAAMRRVLAKRIDLEAVFGDQAELIVTRLARASGGHVREFLKLCKELIQQASGGGPPYTMEDAQGAIAAFAEPYATSWTAASAALARDIYFSPVPYTDDQFRDGDYTERSDAFALAMDQYLVLGYRNGQLWYDVHPLAARRFEREADAATQKRAPKPRS